MKPKVNVFGQRICLLEGCPAYFTVDGEYGGGCNAKLTHWGRVTSENGEVEMGMLCYLPVEFELIRSK